MFRHWLGRLAAQARARVFLLEGAGPPPALGELRLLDDILVLDSPRSASVLLVVGDLPESLHGAARQAHDMLACPRATVWWRQGGGPAPEPFPRATVVAWGVAGEASIGEVAAAVAQVHRALLSGWRPSDPALLPDVDPHPWRGIGPYGQGGAGMTGGVPYGRPITGRAPDRDGLELDQLPVRVGPFFPAFPPGLVLDLRLQGDVIQDVAVPGNAFSGGREDVAAGGAAPPRDIATIERARARHHLLWLAHALRVHGLDALGRRARGMAGALARHLPPNLREEVVALRRLLERTRALGWATDGVGVTPSEWLMGRGLGPVARAAGLMDDARAEDPAYAAVGFEPLLAPAATDARSGADARARWRQRIAEAIQSLELAQHADAAAHEAGIGALEGPRGMVAVEAGQQPPSATLLAMLPDLLQDQEWGDAVTTVVSLDIDMREAAAGMSPLRPPEGPKTGPSMGRESMGAMGGMAHGHQHGR